jgi:BirA family biotin operon repressor/biotin-[acetyl-CoA-carboxylase] ligase
MTMHESGWLGRTHIDLAVCDSTNDEAKELAARGAAHGTVVTARSQRAGRGRHGRSWYSPEHENLYYSCILRPACEPSAAPPITLAAGLAVADAIEAATGQKPGLKWPNDVLLQGRKLAGILAETSMRGPRLEYVIVGIGVNLGTRAFPDELRDLATSLYLECGQVVERARFIDVLNTCAERWFDRFFTSGARALVQAWMARAKSCDHGLGRRVTVDTSSGPLAGHITGLDVDGRLEITDAHGRVHAITAGVLEYRD